MTPTATQTREDALRAMHALGRCGRAIALELGISNSLVNRLLNALGLKPHGQRDPLTRQRHARNLRARAKLWGCSTGKYMRQRQRVAAMLAGWPGAKCPADVRVMDAVVAAGPQGLPLAGVMAASGLSQDGARKAVRRLRDAGLLAPSQGGSRRLARYRLAPGVVPPCREGRGVG